MISSPLILAGIYTHNREAVYYFSSLMAVMNMIIMTILACRRDSKTLGKSSVVTEGDGENSAGSASIELPVVKEVKEEEKLVEENVMTEREEEEEKKDDENGDNTTNVSKEVITEEKEEEKKEEVVVME